eukprot:c22459_g1_i2 orf=369-1013(-)
MNTLEKTAFPNLNFSVSHHGAFVALASDPLCLVGLDVMADEARGQELPEQFLNNFTSYFTELEWKHIANAGPETGPMLDQFYRFWCLKESYTKAVGIGLHFEFERAEFYYPNGDPWSNTVHLRIDGEEKRKWHFDIQRLGTDHWACVARGPPAEAAESFKKTLSKIKLDTATLNLALELQIKPFSFLSISDLISDMGNHDSISFLSSMSAATGS